MESKIEMRLFRIKVNLISLSALRISKHSARILICSLAMYSFLFTRQLFFNNFVFSPDVLQLGVYDYDTMLSESDRFVNDIQLFNTSCHLDLLGLTNYPSFNCLENDPDGLCRNLTCQNLLSGKVAELYNYARDLMKNHSKPNVSDSEFIQLTSNCSEFIRERGYLGKMMITEDSDFPVAFNVLVHRSAEQVERLIYALYRPYHQFCIHIDNKTDSTELLEALSGMANCLSSNVFVASKLERITYAGYSRLQADINCMQDHVTRDKPWKYIINTAGEAFPLRSQREMIKILRHYQGTNDIEGIYGRGYYGRYRDEYLEVKGKIYLQTTGRKNSPPPHDVEIVKGSAYGAFSRDFVKFILTNRVAVDLRKWFRTTWSPDEMYWATINNRFLNPHIRAPGGYSGRPTSANWMTVYTNWVNENCSARVTRGICVIGVSDLPVVVRRRELFVNKFHADFEPLALDCLRAWVEHKDVCPVQFNYDVYRQLPRVKERVAARSLRPG